MTVLESLRARAQRADETDPLASGRTLFEHKPGRIYLDGNSLGPPAKVVAESLHAVVKGQWQADLIAGWNDHDWLTLPRRVGDMIAPLLGAAPGQVLCCDTLSTNLFKLICAALALQQGRHVVLSEEGNFPTDNYIAQGIGQLLGPDRAELRLLPRDDLATADFSDVAVVVLSHVSYRSGALYDLPKITRRAREQGALIIWDLAHSTGAVDLALDLHDVDMAVGCTYKFLNAGPGAPGYLYVAQRLQSKLQTPIWGWMGHARLFDFDADYAPATGIERFLTGTQSVLALSATEAALSVFDGIDPRMLREKSLALTDLFFDNLAAQPLASTLSCSTPRASNQRGSQVCLHHEEGYALAQALIAENVIVDFRAPDIVRFGFSPMVNSFTEVVAAVEVLEHVLKDKRYQNPEFAVRKAVT